MHARNHTTVLYSNERKTNKENLLDFFFLPPQDIMRHLIKTDNQNTTALQTATLPTKTEDIDN